MAQVSCHVLALTTSDGQGDKLLNASGQKIRTLEYYGAKFVEQTVAEAFPHLELWSSWMKGIDNKQMVQELKESLKAAPSITLGSCEEGSSVRRMASKKCGAAIGLAGAVAGSAFIAGTGSSSTKSSALRGVKTPQVQAVQAPISASTTASYAAASVVAASAGVLLARRPGTSFSRTTVTALQAFEQELGVQPPVGFWDPAGLSKDGDVETFQRRRSVELKHGRIAMLATMGYITPEIAGKFPGYLSPSAGLKFADVPNGLAAISKVPPGGWTQILLYMGWCEVSRGPGSDIASGRPGLAPNLPNGNKKSNALIPSGDFGWYVLTSADPEQKKQKLNAELANGRLAMMAIIGMFYQDGLTGSAWGDWSLYTDSPLRAFENETGVQPPVGFWDPLGLSVTGNLSDYKRRREVELKHGRVAMFATIGYILPEYWRFPGYLSKFLDLRQGIILLLPSDFALPFDSHARNLQMCASLIPFDIKFAEVPNGLSAFSKVPALGWLQIVGFAGIVELNIYNEQVNNEPGNYGAGFLGLRSVGFMNAGIADPEVRKKKLNAELANGRLAMFAIIGMFFQDGLTGSAWGDWANYTDSPLRSGVKSPGYNTLPEWEKPKTGCSLSCSFEGLVGDQAPLGFWDPLGLSADKDVEVFKRPGGMLDTHETYDATECNAEYMRRETEIKHGRVAMFATIGYIVPEYYKFDGFLSPSMNLKFTDALSVVPKEGWAQIVAFAGFLELVVNKKTTKKLSAEVANGRLAMMAIIGMFFQDGLTGSAWGDWANYTDSPLRAFEGELGVQPPVGFWDPLGLSADGDVAVFKRRREVELKHGRISMFAAIGYIVPEYFKWPGDLSPKLGLKFADIPNGLAAISKVPGQGWAQIVAFLGTYELFINKPVGAEPGNYGKGNLGLGFLGPVADPEARKKKLSAELANGRLAMMAIIGMFFQDGLTGSAWGDWANYTDSPLRSGVKSPGYNTLPEWEKPKNGCSLSCSFEGLVGDQAPLGFWDPLGLSADKDVEVFKRPGGMLDTHETYDATECNAEYMRRETEIKHGRVAMFATIGYIVPEYYKFDGFLSPSMNLKFTDVPNGLKALSVVPKEGWAQIVAFAGFLELVVNKKTSEPGNYGKGNLGLGLIGFGNSVQDPALRTF
eukprot:symbB.v1.2.006213.t1/scaffold355.1/size243294/23